jgi:class 3 adenylate cyclase/TolB-like protein/cytochrome c-type biogenesis protein CcmH/NrfG
MVEEHVQRKLVAILAADVVGYSRLMSADEEATLAALKSCRDVIDPLIEARGGRIFGGAGDSIIAEFASPVEAVRCATEIQLAIDKHGADVSDDQRMRFRIGVNLGDVIVDGDDLMGDGVNVAARLEALAEPGGICVSQAVVDQARGKVAVGFEDLGEKALKNIAAPVRVYRVVADGAVARASPPGQRPGQRRLALGAAVVLLLGALVAGGWYLIRPAPVAALSADRVMTIKGPAIAALPFANLSGDTEYDLFARGMSDQVAAALIRFKGVRILSPRASAQYADDLKALRSELGADYLLEGNIRRGAERMQITAILTKVETGAQIWTETFQADVAPTNIVEVQDQLAGRIAGAIADESRGVAVRDRVSDRASAAPNDQRSLDCAIASGTWRSDEEFRAAYQCLQNALERDPRYAAGWARLAKLYVDSYVDDLPLTDDPVGDLRSLMLEAARKAVNLAPNSAEAHYALAEAHYYNDKQTQFLAEAAKVLELNPNDAGAIAWLGTLMAFSGRWDEGGALVEKALAFNPSVVSPSSRYALAKAHYYRGEYAEALEDFEPIWAAWPGYWVNDLNRAYLYADWGKQEKAGKAAAALMEQLPEFVVEDAADFYRRLRFQEAYIDKMVRALKNAGLPSRGDS